MPCVWRVWRCTRRPVRPLLRLVHFRWTFNRAMFAQCSFTERRAYEMEVKAGESFMDAFKDCIFKVLPEQEVRGMSVA